jgi:hypothetical protein
MVEELLMSVSRFVPDHRELFWRAMDCMEEANSLGHGVQRLEIMTEATVCLQAAFYLYIMAEDDQLDELLAVGQGHAVTEGEAGPSGSSSGEGDESESD